MICDYTVEIDFNSISDDTLATLQRICDEFATMTQISAKEDDGTECAVVIDTEKTTGTQIPHIARTTETLVVGIAEVLGLNAVDARDWLIVNCSRFLGISESAMDEWLGT